MTLQASKGSVVVWTLLFIVIILSFASTLTTNHKLADAQKALVAQANAQKVQSDCTQAFLAQTVQVLNDRTKVAPELNSADASKVRAEGRLFGFLVFAQASTPPGARAPQSVVDRFNALTKAYFNSITKYLTVLGRTDISQTANPFPTRSGYRDCLQQKPK